MEMYLQDNPSSSTTITNQTKQKTLAASYLYDKKCSFIEQEIIFIQHEHAIKDDFRTKQLHDLRVIPGYKRNNLQLPKKVLATEKISFLPAADHPCFLCPRHYLDTAG